jgi:hypothetical protein
MRRASLSCLAGYPLVFVVACGTGFSASSPDGGGSIDGGGGADSVALGEGGGPEAGGGDTGGGETGGPEGGGLEAGGGEAGASDTGTPAEGGSPGTSCGPGLVCNGMGGQQGTICCVDDTSTPSYACAGSDCGCATQLACASDADCKGAVCCIDKKTDAGCGGGHFVSSCRATCLTATHMCDPAQAASACLIPLTCSPDTSTVDLPAGAGFGICK